MDSPRRAITDERSDREMGTTDADVSGTRSAASHHLDPPTGFPFHDDARRIEPAAVPRPRIPMKPQECGGVCGRVAHEPSPEHPLASAAKPGALRRICRLVDHFHRGLLALKAPALLAQFRRSRPVRSASHGTRIGSPTVESHVTKRGTVRARRTTKRLTRTEQNTNSGTDERTGVRPSTADAPTYKHTG